MFDHSQEAQFQSKQDDKGHCKTIHSDYVATHSGHKELNKMSIKARPPSLSVILHLSVDIFWE